MGLQFFHSSFLPALYSITILVYLQQLGMKPSLHMSYMITLRASINYSPPTYTRPNFIWSGPGALNGFMDVIASLISSIVNAYSGSSASLLLQCEYNLFSDLVKPSSVSKSLFLLKTFASHCSMNSSSSYGFSSIRVLFFLLTILLAVFHASFLSSSFISSCFSLAPCTLFFHSKWS